MRNDRSIVLACVYRRAFQVMQYGTTSQKLEVMNIINMTNQFAFMGLAEISEVAKPIHQAFFQVLCGHPEILDGQVIIQEAK